MAQTLRKCLNIQFNKETLRRETTSKGSRRTKARKYLESILEKKKLLDDLITSWLVKVYTDINGSAWKV